MEKQKVVNYTTVVGMIIKTLRKKEKINQTEFANLLDLNQSSITRIENGTQNISMTQLWKISSLFGYTVSEFMKFVETTIDNISKLNIEILYDQKDDAYQFDEFDISNNCIIVPYTIYKIK